MNKLKKKEKNFLIIIRNSWKEICAFYDFKWEIFIRNFAMK